MKSKVFMLIIIGLTFLFFPCCEPDDNGADIDPRDKFTGTWIFTESPVKSDLNVYQVIISKDPTNTAQVLLQNFAGIGQAHTVEGIVTSNRITIDRQTRGTVSVGGSGTSASNTLMNWTYFINDGADEISYTAIAQKQ